MLATVPLLPSAQQAPASEWAPHGDPSTAMRASAKAPPPAYSPVAASLARTLSRKTRSRSFSASVVTSMASALAQAAPVQSRPRTNRAPSRLPSPIPRNRRASQHVRRVVLLGSRSRLRHRRTSPSSRFLLSLLPLSSLPSTSRLLAPAVRRSPVVGHLLLASFQQFLNLPSSLSTLPWPTPGHARSLANQKPRQRTCAARSDPHPPKLGLCLLHLRHPLRPCSSSLRLPRSRQRGRRLR